MTARRTGPGALAFLVAGPQNAAAIARIIAATGLRPDDEEKLAGQIVYAVSNYDVSAHSQKYMTKTNLNRVRRMRQRVEAMAEQARSDPLPLVSATAKSLDEITRRLHMEEQWQQRHAERRSPKARNNGKLTPIEWLAGAELPTIFEQRFSLPASFDRDNAEQPVGPLIDFVAAVFDELGLEYSRNSIARAVTRFNGVPKPARE
jgi:hypothetical protein